MWGGEGVRGGRRGQGCWGSGENAQGFEASTIYQLIMRENFTTLTIAVAMQAEYCHVYRGSSGSLLDLSEMYYPHL